MAWNNESANAEPADVMLVSAHPDDEGIFGGGLLPYYAQVLDLNVVVLAMCTTDNAVRFGALKRAVDVYSGNGTGVTSTQFGSYLSGNIALVAGGMGDNQGADVPGSDGWSMNDPRRSWRVWRTDGSGRAAARDVVSSAIATFRPRVVACVHNLRGDYGHTNHTATSIATVDGVEAARASGSASPGVEKLYVRGTTENNTCSWTDDPDGFVGSGGLGQLFHDDWERRIIAGSSARQVANHGVRQHSSEYYLQPQVSTVFCAPLGDFAWAWQGNPSEEWTLYRSWVGNDSPVPSNVNGVTYDGWARGDFLEHSSLSATAPPDTAPGMRPTAVNVSVVQFDGGSFEHVGGGRWQEYRSGSNDAQTNLVDGFYLLSGNDDTPAPFKAPVAPDQIQRWLDGTTVVLVELDADGNPDFDRVIQIDMAARRIHETGQASIGVTDANQRVNGRAVRSATFGQGSFQQIRDANGEYTSTWKEFDNDFNDRFTFRETNRDMWSTYLIDEGQRRIQIDVHRLKIRYADLNNPDFFDLYDITAVR